MKKTRGKILTKNDVENIELMLKKGFNLVEISRIIGCSDTTVSRVRDGRHVLQLADKPAEHQPDEHQPDECKNSVEQKLDVIIGLLNEILQAWK